MMSTRILKLAIVIIIVMVIIVFAGHIAFKAIDNSSFSAFAAIWITESGGKYGTAFILIVTCVFYTRFIPGHRNKLTTMGLTLVKLIAVIGVFAYLNEHLIKLALKMPRPSHAFIVERSDGLITLDHLYAQSGSERHALLFRVMQEKSSNFTGIHPHVLSHWAEETGYSFPSGHSFNGFLLAFILSFSLYHSRSATGRSLYFLPLIWAALVAISRVALGAHTPWDVSFGAITGVLIAFLLMHYNLLRDNLLHRRYSENTQNLS